MNTQKLKFHLHEHPWLAMIVEIVVGILCLLLVAGIAKVAGLPGNGPYRPLLTPGLVHVLTLFIIVPFVLRLPNGKRSFREYLSDIRLTNLKPFFPLLMLGLSCTLLALLALSTQSVAFRLSRGLPVTASFVRWMIPLKFDLQSSINSSPVIFEEVLWRGVMLVMFMRVYSEKKSILITGLGFSALHLLNLVGGVPLEFVLRQVIFTAGMGIFYGVLVIRSNSLLPAMLFHYLVNLLIGSFTFYIQGYAPESTQIYYLLINIPFTTLLLIGWVKFYSTMWLNPAELRSGGPVQFARELP